MQQSLFKSILCKESFNSFGSIYQLGRALFWHTLVRSRLITHSDETIKDQVKDRIHPFDEDCSCEMCGKNSITEKLVTTDDSQIVECDNCGLWFTSPRIKEKLWEEYLKSVTPRSIEFTNNRLKYGVCLNSNIKYVLPCWRKHIREMYNEIMSSMENRLGRTIERIHDVGCGVGFFLQDAEARGMKASGNELNAYAYKV